jgi:hypothetical protein
VKRFNLTFRGEIHPEFDIEQVKSAFAGLFQLSDLALVEEIFSGEAVLLRSDMDRKTAAEYYLQLSKAGAVAQIVPVTSPPGQNSPARALGRELLLAEPLNGAAAPRASAPSFRGTDASSAEQKWAVSSRVAGSNGSASNGLDSTDPAQAAADPVATAIMNANEEQARQIRAEAADEIAGLQLSAELAEKNAAEGQRRLAGLARQAEARAQAETQRLRTEGDSVSEQLEATMAEIDAAEKQARESLESERRRLGQERTRTDNESKARLKALKDEAVATVEDLDQALDSVRHQEAERVRAIDDEIALLEQRIGELRSELASAPERLETLLRQTRADNEQRLESLHHQGEQTLLTLREQEANFDRQEREAERALEQRLEALEGRRASANGKAVGALARIKDQESDIARVLEDTLAKLREREAEARAEAADKLALLKAREQLVVERQARELAALGQTTD